MLVNNSECWNLVTTLLVDILVGRNVAGFQKFRHIFDRPQFRPPKFRPPIFDGCTSGKHFSKMSDVLKTFNCRQIKIVHANEVRKHTKKKIGP